METRDDRGFLRGFSYHDGVLEGVSLQSGNLQLSLRSLTGDRRNLILHGVKRVRIDDFREGNIVLDMRCLRSGDQAYDEEVARRVAEKLGGDGRSLGEDDWLFLLDSSYGAEVVAVCTRVEVSDVLPE